MHTHPKFLEDPCGCYPLVEQAERYRERESVREVDLGRPKCPITQKVLPAHSGPYRHLLIFRLPGPSYCSFTTFG